MNKIKKAWKENRVMFVLVVIVIVCILIIGGVMLKYFFGVSTSNYGDRLVDIKDVPFSDEEKEKIKEGYAGDTLQDISIETRGKIIYVVVHFHAGISLVEAQNKSVDIYNAIDEKYRKLYDFNVTLIQDATDSSDGFSMMGAHNVNGSAFVWSNNTPFSSDEE